MMSKALNADITYRVSCSRYLENLVASRDFTGAISYYESIHDDLIGQTDEYCGKILRLAAHAYGSSNRFPQALRLIRTAIDIICRHEGDTDALAECYMVLGDIFRDMSKFDDAEKAYRDAESIFRRGGNTADTGRALNRAAGILFWKGDLDGSLKCLLEAVEAAKNANNKKRLAYLFGNIGRIYTLIGKLKSAEDHILMNIKLSEEFDDQVELGKAWLSMGYVQIQLMQFEDAHQSLDNALDIIRQNRMDRQEIIYLTYAGELALKEGNLTDAEQILNEAYTRGDRVADGSFLAARPLRHLAELYAIRGNYRKAQTMTNRSLGMFRKLNDSVETGALYRIQAVCHEKLGRKEEAKKTFRKAISLLEECKARFELADCMAAAGKSSVFSQNRRFMYLYRAEELYRDCGIKPKIDEMQRSIGECTVPAITGIESDKSVSEEFHTRNPEMKRIVSQLKLLRNSDLPILFTGDTGTGKDFLAQYFHSFARPDQPYMAINCAAIPDTLIESELFGYERGAFTGADARKTGLFQAANHGVLLLDEIGELPLTVQAKLLSILETKKLRPLGTASDIDLDIIILAATNRDLEQMVEEGTFRRDLYYRLAGITFKLPPLRERKEDIPYLLELFMKKFGLLDGAKPDPDMVQQFVTFDWPGNVRELENEVRQLALLSSMAKDGSILELSHSKLASNTDQQSGSLFAQVEELEKKLMIEALISSGGNKCKAARMLEIHEATFRAKMKRYGLPEMLN